MRSAIATCVIAAACGPGASVVDGGATAATTSTTASTSTSSSTSTSAPDTTTDPSSDSSSIDDTGGTLADSGGSSGGAYEEDGGGTGCAFTCPAPPGGGGGGGGIAIECDVWAQDCPEGEKCMPWANDGGPTWNATRCSPLDPEPDSVGEPCTVEGSGVSGIDSCGIAQMCWDVDDQNIGECIAFCEGSEANPVCAGDDACLDLEVFSICVTSCDPLLQDCPPDEACAPTVGEHLCVPAGPANAGDSCLVDGCSAGNTCVDGVAVPGCTALACCTSYCDPLGMPCPMNTQCQALDVAPTIGVCVLP